MELYSYI